jgi:hypothetical protein
LLNADQFHRLSVAVILDAKRNYLANPLHQCVECTRLGMTARKTGHAGHLVSVFISFDDHGEFLRGLHEKILACGRLHNRASLL